MRILHLLSTPLYSGALPPTLGLALAQQRLGHTVGLLCDSKRGGFSLYEEAALPRLAEHAFSTLCAPLVLSTKENPWELWHDVAALRHVFASGARAGSRTEPGFAADSGPGPGPGGHDSDVVDSGVDGALAHDQGKWGVDVVHVHLSHDHMLCGIARRAVFQLHAKIAHGPVLIRTVHADRSLHPRFGQRWLLSQTDGWITRCESHRQTLLREWGMVSTSVTTVPGGIDATTFAPMTLATERRAARQKWQIPEDAVVIVHVALMVGRGHVELIQALEQCAEARDVHLLFVGRGELEAHVQRRAAASPLHREGRIHFAGYLQDEALLQAYAAADVAFLAQPGNDASARAALEAMACGLPVLGVRTGALADIVGDQARAYGMNDRTPATIAEGIRAMRKGGVAAMAQRGVAAQRWITTERTYAHEALQTCDFYARTRRRTGE